MDSVNIKVAAKINLGLDVLGKNPNGYHNIKTVMHSINIFDDLTFEKSNKINITCDNPYVPCNENNLVYKCIKAIAKESGNLDKLLNVNIQKNIPVAAGLGGGSSNGAAALVAYNQIYELNYSTDKLKEIAKELGADIPFLIDGGVALCEGIGEKMRVLYPQYSYYIVLCKPKFGISTKEAYEMIDKYGVSKRPDFTRLMHGLLTGNKDDLSAGLINVFEDQLFKKYPVLHNIKEDIYKFSPLGAQMSGSGPSIFGIFSDEESAQNAFKYLNEKYKETYFSSFGMEFH